MKFSVLLPTRNRLEYLRYAVDTVRRQDYDQWEIIISDNHSEDDIAGYVAELADPRIRYVRTDSFVPVTENWNNALDLSTGDYVVMLGDDDGLLPGYFSRLMAAMRDYPDPDFIYVSALFFAYPGVMPDAPDGFLRTDQNRFFSGDKPYWLDADTARGIARGYLDFRMPVASNMQFSLISRRAIDAMKAVGPFFQSPYPDFYATPALFLTSTRILVYPKPFVVIGITPKSYGFFHFNNRSGDGVDLLNNNGALAADDTDAIRLPGTSYNDSWLLAMKAFEANFSGAYGMAPDIRRYRFLQIVYCYKHSYFDRSIAPDALATLKARMALGERLTWGIALPIGFSALRLVPTGLRTTVISRLRRLIGQHAISDEAAIAKRFENLIDVYAQIDAHGMASV
jgi:glycosyltransferase involved in cell wall biosynthesis